MWTICCHCHPRGIRSSWRCWPPPTWIKTYFWLAKVGGVGVGVGGSRRGSSGRSWEEEGGGGGEAPGGWMDKVVKPILVFSDPFLLLLLPLPPMLIPPSLLLLPPNLPLPPPSPPLGGRIVIIGSRGTININPGLTMMKELEVLGLTLFASTSEEEEEAAKGG